MFVQCKKILIKENPQYSSRSCSTDKENPESSRWNPESTPWNLLIQDSLYREEKSLRHVVMVAKFLDDSKPRILLKVNRTVSNFIDLIQFQ